jgi:serine/threonine-protein phosphatase 5
MVVAFGGALNDANDALKLDPKYLKAYYRRAAANLGLNKFKASKRDFEAVLKAKPNDKDAQLKRKHVEKIIQMRAFARAIRVEEKQAEPIADRIRKTLDSIRK